MLFTQESNKSSYLSWNQGKNIYSIGKTVSGNTIYTAISCRLGSQQNEEFALLDTGAAYTVIPNGYQELLEDDLGEPFEEIIISTRCGNLNLTLYPLIITLVAKDGNDLEIQSTVGFPKEEVSMPIILGIKGFMDRFRFALDPDPKGNKNYFYFGTQQF